MIIANKGYKLLLIISIVVSLVFVQTACAFGAQSETLDSETTTALAATDLTSSHWAYKTINTLVGLGGISGYPDGTFKPNGTITYAELVSILLGATGNDNTVDGTNWAQGILQKAYDAKIVSSSVVPLGDANKAVTRGKMALILSNSAEELRGEELVTLTDIDKYVRDWSSISQAYQEYVNQCVSAGLIQGDASSNFNASSKLTRAEASTIALRLIDETQRLTPAKFISNTGSTTADGYTIVAQGTNISDYVKDARGIKALTDIVTGESNYKVLDNGNKFGLTLVGKQTGWFSIQYICSGKVLLIGTNGESIDVSLPHTEGETVKDAWNIDLSTVKYFVFKNVSDDTNYIVPNTL